MANYPDLIGKKHVNFSVDVGDKKCRRKYKRQRTRRGFDDTETWNMDLTIFKFILPRLKVFKKVNIAYPPEFETFEDWQNCIQTMIDFMEKYCNSEDRFDEVNYREDIGYKNFCKYMLDLTW